MEIKNIKHAAGDDPEPVDDITRMANAGYEAVKNHPEYRPDMRILVLIHYNTEEGMRGGFCGDGYGETDEEVQEGIVADLTKEVESIITYRTGVQVRLVPAVAVDSKDPLLDDPAPFLMAMPPQESPED
jgi:hypothetical protein